MIDPALSELLAEAIHGGAKPDSTTLAQALGARGIPVPGVVVAVQSEVETSALLAVGRPLAVHPGLRYWCSQDPIALTAALDAERIVHGPAYAFADADAVVRAIQQAIVSMREVALAHSREVLGEDPGFASEQGLAAVLLHDLRTADAQWQDTARVWIDTILWRHRLHLNTIRRKFVEMLGLCTRDCDQAHGVGTVLRQAILRIYAAFALDDLRQAAHSGLEQILAAIAREQPQRQARSATLRAAMAWLEAHYLEPISLADVARAVGVGATHLAHCCRRELGCTVLDRIHALRLEHAKELLVHSRDNVLEVALASGFPSVEHFHRCFRVAVGTTPRRFRRDHALEAGRSR